MKEFFRDVFSDAELATKLMVIFLSTVLYLFALGFLYITV